MGKSRRCRDTPMHETPLKCRDWMSMIAQGRSCSSLNERGTEGAAGNCDGERSMKRKALREIEQECSGSLSGLCSC